LVPYDCLASRLFFVAQSTPRCLLSGNAHSIQPVVVGWRGRRRARVIDALWRCWRCVCCKLQRSATVYCFVLTPCCLLMLLLLLVVWLDGMRPHLNSLHPPAPPPPGRGRGFMGRVGVLFVVTGYSQCLPRR